jgi:hypothetical protein
MATRVTARRSERLVTSLSTKLKNPIVCVRQARCECKHQGGESWFAHELQGKMLSHEGSRGMKRILRNAL